MSLDTLRAELYEAEQLREKEGGEAEISLSVARYTVLLEDAIRMHELWALAEHNDIVREALQVAEDETTTPEEEAPPAPDNGDDESSDEEDESA